MTITAERFLCCSLMKMFAVLLLCPVFASAQYSESFESVQLLNFTGPLPAGWKQYNEDGLLPASAVNWIGNQAWVVRDTWWDAGGNKAAASISYYTPPGTSDDWLVSPLIQVPATNPYLRWKSCAPAPSFQDGYQVWIVPATAVPCDTNDFPAPCDFMSVPSQKIFETSAAPTSFESFGVALDSWAGQQVYLAWRNNSTDKYILYVDDIQVLSLPNHYDVSLDSVGLDRFVPSGMNALIHVRLRNKDALPVNSITVAWSDGSNTYSHYLTGLNIPPGGTYTFIHPYAFNAVSAGEFLLTVTASQPNGQTDINPSDNTLNKKISIVGTKVPKVVVIEEGTGTSCGWCPRGYTAMEHLHSLYPESFAGIVAHINDPMEVPLYNDGLNFWGIPSCHVDRHLKNAYVSVSMFEIYYNNFKDLWPPAALSVTAQASGDMLTVEVKADFVTTCSDEFRLAVVLTEDSVRGTGPGYAQTNYYSGGNQSMPYGPIDFMTQPNPVPDSVMWYDHTARALLGGFDGQANSVPAPAFVNGGSHTYTFNYTIPADYNKGKMKAIALLIETATGRIWNAGKAKISAVSVGETPQFSLAATAYPIPANDIINLSFNLDKPEPVEVNVYDLNGRLLMSRALGTQSGPQQLTLVLDVLPEGHYLLSVATPTRSHTQHLTIVR